MGFNILYVGFFSLPDKDAAANRVMNNAKALRECGHNVIFIDEQVDYEYESIEQSLHIINGFETWTLKRPQNQKEYFRKMVSIQDIIKVVSIYKKIDLIIAYNYPAIALWKLLCFCIKRGIKIASDCTEWYSGKEYSFPKNILCAIDSCLRMRVVNKKLDGIICISDYLEKYYEKNKHIKVVNIPPLVDKKNAIWEQKRISLDTQRINLVYAGNPGKSKENLLPIIAAINLAKKDNVFRFHIVGITEQQFIDLYPEATSLVNKMNGSIIFYGRKTHSETIRIIQASDYMIFIRENNRVSNAGFSTKFVEAISCGTAVITTNTGSLEKYINKYNLGYIVHSEKELVTVFDSLSKCMRNKSSIDDNLFHYNNYKDAIDNWMECI